MEDIRSIMLKFHRYKLNISRGRVNIQWTKTKNEWKDRLKVGLIYAVLLSAFMAYDSQAVEQDKFLHLGASMAIAGSVMYVTEDWRMAFGSCMAVGLAKELYDEYGYGGFDEKDLLADAIGCGVGYWMADYGLRLEATENSVAINYRVDF